MQLERGQRVPLAALMPAGGNFSVLVSLAASGAHFDVSSFGIDGSGRLSDERYLTFFNAPSTPCGGVEMVTNGPTVEFRFQLPRLPPTIDRLVLTASLDGAGTLAQLQRGCLQFQQGGSVIAEFPLQGSYFTEERAVILGELYRKDDAWRFSATAQGFNGGLDALVRHFGGEVAEPVTSPAVKVDLEKRIQSEAPQLVSLVKTAKVSLEKVGLGSHRAKVALCIDISGSMSSLFKSGKIQAFAERILALGCRFDDDGEIDVFLFGADVHQPPAMGLGNAKDYVRTLMDHYQLEGDTRYGKAIEAIRRFYFPGNGGGAAAGVSRADVPVYVMFLTDGSTSDKPFTQKQLRWASYEPIFWQFIGIGKSSKSRKLLPGIGGPGQFEFLERLDTLDGRLIDNAGFFSVMSPDEHPDEALYDLLMEEYPQWLKLARAQQMIG
jgi:stress response protein SCP2